MGIVARHTVHPLCLMLIQEAVTLNETGTGEADKQLVFRHQFIGSHVICAAMTLTTAIDRFQRCQF